MPDYTSNLPPRMRGLPIDEAGRPVPKFVEWIDGKPDFRIMSSKQLRDSVMHRYCWVCGQQMGAHAVFTAGPMCLINLNSAEPPSHYECALYSATHCPFLTNPNKVRREGNMPEDPQEPAGMMIARNPGVTALIVVKHWTVWREGSGILFNIGTRRLNGPAEIERVEWYAYGRPATREEVVNSIDTGMPALVDACGTDQLALTMLARMVDDARKWLPDA